MEGTYVSSPEPEVFEPNIRPDCTEELTVALRERIMVIDGAMGTAIQR
ncbi:MAG: methionine synthase, partial [Mycobacterium sp.]|nr:methionine synthase [Mycobacterium sp.]